MPEGFSLSALTTRLASPGTTAQGPRSAMNSGLATQLSTRSTLATRHGSKALWSLYARVYDEIWDSPLTDLIAFTAFDVSAGPDVVDLGCGTGLVSQVFVRHGCTVTGVDTSARMLHRAQSRCRISTAVLATVTNTPLPSQSADTVLLINVLHLLSDPAAALGEALRIVKPGGRIVLAWPLDDVTTDSIRQVDRLTGRGTVQSTVAHHLRQAIGIVGWTLRIARRRPGDLCRIVDEMVTEKNLELEGTSTIQGVQQICVLRISEASTRIESSNYLPRTHQ